MMTKIREKTHLLLYVLVFAFVALIVVEWGANYSDISRMQRGIIGKIGGEDIRYADFQVTYFNQVQQTQQQKGGESLSESEMEGVSDQVWSQMLEEHILRTFIRKNEITVGDSEIAYNLKTNPPDFLKQSPSFQTDGKFDAQKYIQALNNPQFGKQWAEIESILRIQLPFNKIQFLVNSAVRVTESELRLEYMRRNLKLAAKLIYFSPAEVAADQVTASAEELKAYYDAHLSDFKEPEKARIAFVNFSEQATAEDSAEIMGRLADVKKQLLEGKDFAELAKIYSADKGSAEQGGDLGWFTRGMMVKEFEDACFGGKPGEIIGPVKTQFGYHLIKVDSAKFHSKAGKKKSKKDKSQEPQDSIMARHILIQIEASSKTVETARENSTAFYDLAKEEGFGSAYEKLGVRFKLRIDTTAEFLNNDRGMVSGFPDRLRSVVRFAFNENREPVTRPIHTSMGFTIFSSVSFVKGGVPPFSAIEDKVKNLVLEEKRKTAVYEKAREIRSKLATIDDIKTADSLKQVKELSNFTMNGTVPGVGRDVKLNNFLFQQPVGKLLDPYLGIRGAYIVQISEREEFNEGKYQAARAGIRQQLMNIKQQKAYREWLEMMKKNTTIEDFRADFNL